MFTLPPLPYSYGALEPQMSRETLRLHHDAHHRHYVEETNKLIRGTSYADKPLEDIVTESFRHDEKLFDNAAQHFNHSLFWQWMSPDGGGELPPELEKRIRADFGSVTEMKTQLIEAGKNQFGSGWVWLALRGDKIGIMRTPNGENPLVHGARPLLGIDVWEHSYYVDYRNRREDYLKAFLDYLVNWQRVDGLLADIEDWRSGDVGDEAFSRAWDENMKNRLATRR